MFRAIVVLSPHRDDAVFSAFLCLSRWSRLGIRLYVINFFTVSAYGPRAHATDAEEVSRVRRREDRKALTRITPSIRILDTDMLDAPIRLSVSERAVCSPETRSLLSDDDVERVAQRTKALSRNSLVLAPLALGDHVDHLAVHAAAIRSAAPQRIAFYEDLPYATWTSTDRLKARVSETERELTNRLKPVIVRASHAVWRKRQAVAIYHSQISREEGTAVARWAAEYGGGERLWVPAHSRFWRSLLERSNVALFE